MKDSEFLNSLDRESIAQTCNHVERAAHKLQLMSVRKQMTITEMQGQVGVIQKWLHDLEKNMKPVKAATKRS